MKQLKSKRSALRCLYWAGSLQLLSDAPMQIYPQRRGEATLCPNTSPMQAERRERDTRRRNAMWQRTTQSDTTGHDRESASQHRETGPRRSTKGSARSHASKKKPKQQKTCFKDNMTAHNTTGFSFFLFVDESTQAQLKQIHQQRTRPITYHQTSGAANSFSDKICERVSQTLSVLPAFNPLYVCLYWDVVLPLSALVIVRE